MSTADTKMSDLRIVLLGSSESENSQVGNFILGRAVFDSEAPPDVVERVTGRLKNRHMIVINSPQLLQKNISDHQITQTVRECVNLSDPGPHVIALLLRHDQCSAEDEECVEKILHSLSEQVYQHTIVITTQEPTETNDILQKIIQKCANRHFSLQRNSSPDDLLQMFEDIEKMNDGRHLDCAEASKDFTVEQQHTEKQGVKLNLVVCGSDEMLKCSISELIQQQTDRRSDVELHGRLIHVVKLPALIHLSEEEVMRQTLHCVSLCHPGVHVFLVVIADAPLNNEDKAEIQHIQRIFSSRINKHILILIKQSSEHQTEELSEEIQAVITSFGGRHHFFGPKTQVSTLMKNIEQMLEENKEGCFSMETFLETQIKKLMKYEEMKKKTDSLEKHLHSRGSTESEEDLRIVLLGKTGVGKSATGNTILGREAFTAETSHESVTKESQRQTSEINSRRVTVIDTPRLFDTELSNEEIQREIRHCISMILPGPHVFIIVLNLGQRFTQEQVASVNIIQETFGENSLMYTLVLFTRGDDLKNKTIEQFLGKPGSPLMNLIEACGNRYHVFNNNQTEDRTQVSDLLEKIDNMVKDNGGSFYSCKMFREMERQEQELQMKILMERVRETEEEMKRLEEDKERMKMMMEEEQKKQDKERKRREEELKIEIREQNKHQRETQDEIRRERETFRQEKKEMKKEKQKLQTEIEILMNRIENERRKREEEYNEREKLYKTLIKEKEIEMHEEMKREREEWEKQKQEEKRTREEEDEKRREKEQRDCDEFNQRLKEERERMERERKDLRSKHEEEKERMRMMMEEERQNQDKERKRREEELREREEQYKREMKEQEEQIRDEMKSVKQEFKNEIKDMRKEMETLKKEKEVLQIRHNTEIDRLMNRIENERKKREEELSEREERYKKAMKEQEQIRDEMRREQEMLKDEMRQEKDTLKKEKENLQIEKDKLMNRIENEKQLNETEKKRREEEFKKREERYKTLIKEKEESEEKMREEMKREQEEWEKKRQEEKTKRETEKQISDEQIHRLQSEMEGIIREKESKERERQEQLEDSKKRLEAERNMREEQQKTFEKKLKLLEEQHELHLSVQRNMKRTGRLSLNHLFHRLHLDIRHFNKLRAADVLQITEHSLQSHEFYSEEELIQTFIQKLLMMNYRARYITTKESSKQDQTHQYDRDSSEDCDIFDDIFREISLLDQSSSQSDLIHPMDVQMAVFHCADGFLKQLMVAKLSQCQYALPLLVPDPFTRQIEFPLWTFRQINKSWKMRNTDNDIISQIQPIYRAQTPMVCFFRFGSVSSSKSQLMNSLINERHNTFFHRNCPGSSRTRELMDGVVEIAWYCPSGKNSDKFNDCVAFCNLHGDAGKHEKQLQILTEMSSVNVVLLPRLDRKDKIIQNLYMDRKPLICLLTEDKSNVRKCIIGLKDRNQADVSEELRKAINDCLSPSSPTFRLEDVSKHSDIRVDEEDDDDCRTGREAAQQMISLLENKHLTEIKESFLPHQKLWHEWSQKNKELHRPQAEKTESEISRIKTEIRHQQHECQISDFIKCFIKEMNSYDQLQKMFFLRWLRILLDEHTSAGLSTLHHKYDDKWSTVLKLKGKLNSLKTEQTELEKISEELQAATFGLEHIMREIGQIYESCSSVKKNKKDLQVHFSSLPSLAAEMMISGFPVELMDGDAAHVPVIWISAVFDQLIQKLGNQTRVFVLSVLGIQSSGKSTMLNAMFGLEFAVSAGRCTRGAFMQLVKVSHEIRSQMNFDYILVVDTEGLHAPELAGRSTRHHDNKLATFVIGLANLTLINILRENLAEMQNILQIVVQAFMRMKKVRLNPSCVFVHQNNSDITAGEKNMEGRRRLQETLDEMTKLAAEEEGCVAERFSDVINFDVQNDVKYFAQLWEGNPPMAPPNPNYCENIQELKKTIVSHASKSHRMSLTHFKDHIKDLWEALLNEGFIFSFGNSLEMAAYRRLENEYSKWSLSLQSAMMVIKDKLHNKIKNGSVCEVDETELQRELNKTSEKVEKSMSEFFEKDTYAEILIQWKTSFETKIKELEENIVRETKRKLNEILNTIRPRKQQFGFSTYQTHTTAMGLRPFS